MRTEGGRGPATIGGALAALLLAFAVPSWSQTVIGGSGDCRFEITGNRDFGNVLVDSLANSRVIVTPVPPTQIQTLGFDLDPSTPPQIKVNGLAGPPPMEVQVSFIPTRVQQYTGKLDIQAFGPNLTLCGEASVDIKGTGLVPFIIEPTALSFGPQLIDVPSEPLSFQITTNGATNFTIESRNDAFTVDPEEFEGPRNQRVEVVFTPTLEGGFTGSIVVRASNSGIELDPQEVSVDGFGMHELLIVTPADLPLSKLDTDLVMQLEATGGFRTRSWSLTPNQSLPPGLTLLANGTLSGIPTQLGTFQFEVQVEDLAGQVDERRMTLVVRESLTEITAVADAAAFTTERGVSPGSLITLFGMFAGQLRIASQVPLPTEIEGVSVRFIVGSGSSRRTIIAPLLFTSLNQINAQVPWEVGGAATTDIVVDVPEGDSAPFTAEVASVVPSFFTLDGTGVGPVVAVNLDGTVAQPTDCCGGVPTRPARKGDGLILYASGLGPLDPPERTGDSSLTQIRNTVERVRVFFAGFEAEVSFAGQAPGFVGVNQINVLEVPSRAPTGDTVAMRLDVGEDRIQTQPGVTVAIQPAP